MSSQHRQSHFGQSLPLLLLDALALALALAPHLCGSEPDLGPLLSCWAWLGPSSLYGASCLPSAIKGERGASRRNSPRPSLPLPDPSTDHTLWSVISREQTFPEKAGGCALLWLVKGASLKMARCAIRCEARADLFAVVHNIHMWCIFSISHRSFVYIVYLIFCVNNHNFFYFIVYFLCPWMGLVY